jgi:LAGLIDADG endonuclease
LLLSNHSKAATATGWQVFPEFVVTQGEKSLQALHDLKEFFECGKIFINRRNDNHKEAIYRFCVRSIADLRDRIIPFFRENQLRTAKRGDLEKFTRVLELMGERKHLNSKRNHGDCEDRANDESQKTIQILRILRDYTPGTSEREVKI